MQNGEDAKDLSKGVTLAALGVMAIVAVMVTLSGRASADGRNQPVNQFAVTDGLKVDTTTTLYRGTTAFTGSDSFTALSDASDLVTIGDGGIADVTTIECGGFATVEVSGTFSVAGANVTLTAAKYVKNANGSLTFVSSEDVTLTAVSSGTARGGRYPARAPAQFSTGARGYMKIRIATDPSSGTFLFTTATPY